MGSAMGQSVEITREVVGWVKEVARIPVWAKMTPNITDITVPARAAIEAGAHGISAINTILSIIGVNLDTLRPM
ncbi:MAG: NAD-dependent dihydropyrimidine dehydrogenase subunit PreA, partial [Nitrospirota bacterium]